MAEPFYITTAISYPNGPPHIGHAYEAIATDATRLFLGPVVVRAAGLARAQMNDKIEQELSAAAVHPDRAGARGITEVEITRVSVLRRHHSHLSSTDTSSSNQTKPRAWIGSIDSLSCG